jgi:hypothetical protein
VVDAGDDETGERNRIETPAGHALCKQSMNVTMRKPVWKGR